ncbi:hypothetical protein VIRA109638_05390 [Vibrio rarus]|uniref:hypothetical protein n=1 Tax=Vibrio rarus TaxID=413403 RepID=UPI0021C37142|nr:hypothetical protein [Vibrio rarus]
MVGNVLEWVDQLKLVDGLIISTADNDPSVDEANWISQEAFLDAVADITLSDKVTIRDGVAGDSSNSGASRHKLIADVTLSNSYTPNLLLRRLLIEFSAKPQDLGALYMRNYGERLPIRGGYWAYASSAGLGALHFNASRLSSDSSIGFRPAFFE